MVSPPDRACFCFYVQALGNCHLCGCRCHLPRGTILYWKVGYLCVCVCGLDFDIVVCGCVTEGIVSNTLFVVKFECSLVGAAVIVVGFYSVLWGKAKDIEEAGMRNSESSDENSPLLKQNSSEEI